MQRRHVLMSLGALAPLAWVDEAAAHHGWSSFDEGRPIYLEGTVDTVKWQNPHVEFMLAVAPKLAVPANFASRTVPMQTAPVDGKALLAKAIVPTRQDARWEIELAPLARMQAWKVPELKRGDAVGLLGFTFREEKGQAICRVEYLWTQSACYALRSSPA
jgi:hypothetical protein